METIEPREKIVCLKCRKLRVIDGNYYANKNPLIDGENLPICKGCIKEFIGEESTPHYVERIKYILAHINKPFLNSLWISTGGKWQSYITQIQSFPQYKDMTYFDSEFEVQEKSVSSSNSITKMDVNSEELIDKWGEGYSKEQYRLFEKKYNKLIRNYGEKTELHTENLLNYIRFRVQEEIATAKGEIKDSKEWAALASKAAQDAKINVSQLSKSDISGGVDVLAQLFEAVEAEASVIPHLPKVLEQPYDDADMIIWANINYNRNLEDKPMVSYRDVWNFYDEMLEEHCQQQGYTKEQTEEFKQKRNNVFRDLANVYVEPLYESDGE